MSHFPKIQTLLRRNSTVACGGDGGDGRVPFLTIKEGQEKVWDIVA